MNVYLVTKKDEEKVLRTVTKPFDFKKETKQDVRNLIALMRKTMKEANGVGLSGNQIGIQKQVFVAEVDNKFYAIFNPSIAKREGSVELEEGCLSVPQKYGIIDRAERVTLSGFDRNGKKIKIKAWGLLAQVFQHEVDHLQGGLFIDKAKKLYVTPKSERLIEREDKKKISKENR